MKVTSKVFSSILITLLFLYPAEVFASTYGSGMYGSGAFGIGQTSNASSSNSNSSNNSSGGGGSGSSNSYCSTQAPTSAPFLYQINTTGNTATVYFAPAGGPYTTHFISFGEGNQSEGYGADLSLSSSKGAMSYKITFLKPNTFYTFKVRGGNGCKPGPWGSNLTVKTGAKNTKRIAQYYPKKQAKYVAPKSASWFTKASTFINNLLPRKF